MEKLTEKLADVILVVLPLCIGYFAGIIYLSAYLASYSISIHEFDLSIQLVLAYSFSVFDTSRFFVYVVVAVVAYVLLQTPCAKRPREWLILKLTVKPNAIVVGLVGCFLGFIVLYSCATESAGKAAERVWQGSTSKVLFNQLPESWEISLTTRQRALYNLCVQKNNFKHIISTTSVTYALCVADDTEKEGLVIGQRHDDGRLLPIRDIGHEISSGSMCVFGACLFST